MNSKGLTLVEMLVVLGIASLMGLYVVTAFIDTFGAYNRQTKEAQLSQETRQATLRMTEDIRQGSGLLDNSGSYTLGDFTLIVKIPSIDCNGVMIRDILTGLTIPMHDTFIYYLDESDATNTKLLSQVIPASSAGPGLPNSCRQAITAPILTRVQNKKDVPAVAIFSDSNGGSPTNATRNVNVRLIAQDIYRTRTVRSDVVTSITLRNP